jgi:hypothetical protein
LISRKITVPEKENDKVKKMANKKNIMPDPGLSQIMKHNNTFNTQSEIGADFFMTNGAQNNNLIKEGNE